MSILHPDIQREINKLYNDSELIELFVLDATAFGGPLFRFTNNPGPSGAGVVFNGNTYTPIPITATGFDITSTGTLPTPSITISNVNKVIQSAVISFGDLIGAKLTRSRTYGKFLDAATFPRRNLFNHSQDFSNSFWQKTAVTEALVTSPVSPRSKKEAFRLFETTASGEHRLRSSAINVVSGQAYTFSAYVKAINSRNVRLSMGPGPAFPGTAAAVFDLHSGTVLTSSGTTARIVDMGAGWWRVSCTSTSSSTTTVQADLNIALSDDITYTGSTSDGLYVFGLQYEQGSASTEYQFTSTSHQPFANPAAVMSETWKVEQMTEMTNTSIQFMLATDLDRLRFKFGRQVLKDQSVKNVFAPGIARTRTR